MKNAKIRVKHFVYMSLLGYILLEPLKAFIISIDGFPSANSILTALKFLKYLFVAFGVIVTGLNLIFTEIEYNKGLKNYIFYREFKQLILVVVVFALISVYFSRKTHKFTSNTFQELLQLMIPAVISIMVLNNLTFDEIYRLFSFALLYSVAIYMIVAGPSIFNITNLLSLNLFDSTSSAFEIHEFAVFANSYISFFVYYRKKNIVLLVITILFNLLTFKRVYVLFSFVYLAIVLLNLEDKEVKEVFITISKGITIALTILFNYFLQPKHWSEFEQIFGVSISDFTTNRALRVLYYLKNFHSYGFGSVSNEMINGYFELDLVKILMETSIIGLTVFVICYWNLSKRNMYCYAIMACQMGNMLFSWSLSRPYKWAIIFITIGCIIYKKEEFINNTSLQTISKKRFRIK